MPTTVCITGGSGFLGAMTVKLCLQRGYTVRTTTRSPSKHEARLKALVPSQASHLTVIQADLLTTDFTEIFRGCDVVMHTASPFFLRGANEDNVVKPAVEGTRNVFVACAAASVPTVIITSSTAAIYGWYGNKAPDHVMTEADWSDEAALVQHENWYCVSKTRAEKLAWALAKQYNIQLAVMNPCLIWGEMLPPALNTSSGAVLSYLDGSKTLIQNCTKCVVSVEDVALAHVLAFEQGQVDPNKVYGQRYLLVGGCPSWAQVARVLSKWALSHTSVPLPIPTIVDPNLPPIGLGAVPPNATLYDVSRAEEVGVNTCSVCPLCKTVVARGMVVVGVDWDSDVVFCFFVLSFVYQVLGMKFQTVSGKAERRAVQYECVGCWVWYRCV
jgi:nucleoside-diphosphate-sugar epimerase